MKAIFEISLDIVPIGNKTIIKLGLWFSPASLIYALDVVSAIEKFCGKRIKNKVSKHDNEWTWELDSNSIEDDLIVLLNLIPSNYQSIGPAQYWKFNFNNKKYFVENFINKFQRITPVKSFKDFYD
jgi:hypothetical protein